MLSSLKYKEHVQHQTQQFADNDYPSGNKSIGEPLDSFGHGINCDPIRDCACSITGTAKRKNRIENPRSCCRMEAIRIFSGILLHQIVHCVFKWTGKTAFLHVKKEALYGTKQAPRAMVYVLYLSLVLHVPSPQLRVRYLNKNKEMEACDPGGTPMEIKDKA
ncbi:hypothetical protein Tco_0098441 [Tanacetum coccineum]